MNYRLAEEDIEALIRIVQINENADEIYADISSILPYIMAQQPKIVLTKNGRLIGIS